MRLVSAALLAVAPLLAAVSDAAADADPPPCEEHAFGGHGITATASCHVVGGVTVPMIVVRGDIEPGDDRYVRQALLAVGDGPVHVSLESDGGDLEAGIGIGRAIWLAEAATVVEDVECASACALAWLAGRPRYMAPGAAIGFHAPWRDNGDRPPEASTAGSAVVGGYLRDLGLTSAAIRYINEPGPDELRYLTMDDADQLNIAVRPWLGGVVPVAEVPVTPAANPPVETPGAVFRDCADCPEMVVVPAGGFRMGSPDSEPGRQADEGPQHDVRFAAPFAIGRTEVTFAQWDACVGDGGCGGHEPDDENWGRGDRPVIDVSWAQARSYAEWLTRKTGVPYRLPSEAEWEYAARAGTATPYAFGDAITPAEAHFAAKKTAPAGTYPPNALGLRDVHGNVWEWVQDCYAGSYAGAPADGSAVSPPGCDWRVVRGGGWNTTAPENMRVAFRFRRVPGTGRDSVGFRVARALGPSARSGEPPR